MAKYIAPEIVDLDDEAFGYGARCYFGSSADVYCRQGWHGPA